MTGEQHHYSAKLAIGRGARRRLHERGWLVADECQGEFTVENIDGRTLYIDRDELRRLGAVAGKRLAKVPR